MVDRLNAMDQEHTKYIYSMEFSNAQRLEVSELHMSLKEAGLLPTNSNMGMFMRDIFYRGFNEYRKELVKDDC